jgi:Protein of unknown function (DUF1580)
MIEHETETVLSLTDAAARLPRRRGGKRVNVATLYRWASHGCRGVRLETLQIGGTKCTSLEALQRFFDRLTNPGCDHGLAERPAHQPAPVRRRERDNKAVAAELERLGI